MQPPWPSGLGSAADFRGLQFREDQEIAMNHPHAFTDALRRPLPEAMVSVLRKRYTDRFSTAQAVRDHHGRDESPFPVVAPDAVVFARSTDEVVAVVDA
ncbi:MAG: hypothetical protein ACLGHY_07740, partial [Gammaproteobacteria bacterium]